MSKTNKETLPRLRFNNFNRNWDVFRFIDTTDKNKKWTLTGGPFGSDLKSEDYTEFGIRIIQLQNIGDGNFIDDNKIFTSNEKADSLLSCNIYPNEIIISKMGDPVARACIIPKNEERYLMSSDGIRYIPDREKFNANYMFQYINSSIFRKQAISLSTGSTRKRIGLTDLKNIIIKSPEIGEQNKIAEFLSSVDKKIQLLEKKKEQLELYKKGVMQKIFSREIRFKDENGNTYPDWERSVLADLFSSKRGQGLSGKNIIEDGKNKCILYGALYTKYDEVIFDVVEKTNEIGSVQSVMGDLLVPASTTTSGIDLANFTALDEDGIYLGGDITIMRSKEKSSNKFWAYYLTHFKKFDVAKYAQGTTIVHLYFNHFKKIKVDVPSYDEQKKIADFILFLDKKIKSTSTLIDKTKEFKKGLLQQMFV